MSPCTGGSWPCRSLLPGPAASRVATSISSSLRCTLGCRTGRVVGTAPGTDGHLAEAPAPAAAGTSQLTAQQPPASTAESLGCSGHVWAHHGASAASSHCAHSQHTVQTGLACPLCASSRLFAQTPSLPHWPRATPSIHLALPSPNPGNTACPQTSALFSKAAPE